MREKLVRFRKPNAHLKATVEAGKEDAGKKPLFHLCNPIAMQLHPSCYITQQCHSLVKIITTVCHLKVIFK